MIDVVNVICGIVALVIVASSMGDLLGEILRGGRKGSGIYFCKECNERVYCDDLVLKRYYCNNCQAYKFKKDYYEGKKNDR